MVAAVTPSIQSLGTALGYRLHADCERPASRGCDGMKITTIARALEGMQKEAIVYSPGSAWRLVCDEGPYLNGTDLAPFPLAFYTAGLIDSYAAAILDTARDRGVHVESLALTQDNRYTMEGSALKGTMIGGSLPVDLEVRIGIDGEEDVRDLVHAAVTAAPGDALARLALPSTFSAVLNGGPLELPRLNPSPGPLAADPAHLFEAARPADGASADALEKLEAAETVFGVEGGAGSSLLAEQKRTLHVRGLLTVRTDGTRETRVQLFKPLGSQFRFVSGDEGSNSPAPDGLTLLSAGIAFCYLTQLTRYAHIVKQNIEACRLLQETVFHPGHPASAEPVDTHVFMESPQTAEDVQQIIAMGERTCFLHANLRGTNNSRVRLNGESL